jgi:hypothetical protein
LRQHRTAHQRHDVGASTVLPQNIQPRAIGGPAENRATLFTLTGLQPAAVYTGSFFCSASPAPLTLRPESFSFSGKHGGAAT